MRPECNKCGASNRHIDELVAQEWQCSACGTKQVYMPETATPEPEDMCVACGADELDCDCEDVPQEDGYSPDAFDDNPKEE